MPKPPKHLRFTLNAPIAGTEKMPPLRAAAVPELLDKSGAKPVPAPMHSRASRDLGGVAKKKQSRILIFAELKLLRGINFSRQHLDRLEKAGKFPRRIQISPARIGWLESELDGWLESKAEGRRWSAASPNRSDSARD